MAAARSRLDTVTQSAGPPATGPKHSGPQSSGPQSDPAQAALAGLASAIGLGDVLYPGREGRSQRARMAQIARQQVITQATSGPASLVAVEGVIAATVYALTAVIQDGAIVASEVVGTRVEASTSREPRTLLAAVARGTTRILRETAATRGFRPPLSGPARPRESVGPLEIVAGPDLKQ